MLAADTAANPPKSATRKSALYLASALAITAGSLGLIAEANRRYAPEMYQPEYMETVAEAFESGESYAVFDLNINIRKLRDEQWKRLDAKPGLIVLGASQWQEASADLLPNRSYLNGHVHRDYYEDVLGMVELLVRHDKLPKDLVITICDRLFTPVAQRTDYLWLPGIPYYQAMADRLSLPRLKFLEQYPLQRPRELISLSMLYANATRWHNAKDWPYATPRKSHTSLDVLHPDGSITWSAEHLALFTQERSRKVSLAHAAANSSKPPVIDPKGVEAMDRLLSYLAVRGVRVHLAHPPFNPIYYDEVQDTPYIEGLRAVETVTRELAAKHKLNVVGSFDPEALGCTAEMFIDAEHSNAPCLRKLLAEIANSIDLPAVQVPADMPPEIARLEMRSRQALLASGWTAGERGDATSEKAALANERTVPAAKIVENTRPSPAPKAPLAVTATPGVPDTRMQEPSKPAVASAEPSIDESERAEMPLPPEVAAPAVMAPQRRAVNATPSVSKPVRAAVKSSPRKAPVVSAAKRRPAVKLRHAAPARPHNTLAHQRLVWPGDSPVRHQ